MIEKKKTAYEILGLKENASRDKIERRFSMLLKKHKIVDGKDNLKRKEIETITDAYNLLMGYAAENVDREAEERERKSFRNFLYYYKLHIAVSVLTVIVLVFFIRGIVKKEPVDLNIAFIGDFYYSETETLKYNIKSSMPDLRDIVIDGARRTENMNAQQEYGMQIKTVTLFSAGKIDVYILDKINFDTFGSQGAFISLDDIVEEEAIEKDKRVILKLEGQESDGVYGIDVGDSGMFKNWDINVPEGQMIAAVGINAEHHENGIEFLKLLLG